MVKILSFSCLLKLNAASSQIIETVEDFMSRYRRAQDAPDFSMTVNTAVDAVQNLVRHTLSLHNSLLPLTSHTHLLFHI